jgi:sulfite reductase (NADPH) flavoprotein alpha-component
MDALTADGTRLLAAAGVLAAYLMLCAGVWRAQRRRSQAQHRAAADLARAGADEAPWLVVHASQTGTAEALAWQSARSLHAVGLPARILSMAQLGLAELKQAGRVLFIVSTYGEGDPPDAAAAFAQRWMAAAPGGAAASLPGLQCAVLALGDRGYANFCGFGRRLEQWLHAQGARPLFERIEVDRGDAQALRAWARALGRVVDGVIVRGVAAAPMGGKPGGATGAEGLLPAFDESPGFVPWRLVERECLNPGSCGEPIVRLAFEPPPGEPLADWDAGDLVQVLPPGENPRPRDYSVASLPSDGCLELLVRRTRRPDGQPGLVSGWLCDEAPLASTVQLRLKAHPGFRIGGNAERPLVLIGNGSGLAGLRAHLKARARAAKAGPVAPCWLLFGEREAAHDALLNEELETWQRDGVIERLDWVFSRDGGPHRYVQHRLAEQADRLRATVALGGAIYVCGSLDGMAGGVEAVLRATLGDGPLEALRAEGRYRRDVY